MILLFSCITGPRCQAANITRRSFEEPHSPHDRHITRGVLLELSSAFPQALFSAVNQLYPNKYNPKQINNEFKTTKQKFSKYNKNKSRSDEGSKYLDDEIEFQTEQTEQAEQATSSKTSGTQSAGKCKGCSEKDVQIKKTERTAQKLTNELKSKQEQVSCMSQKEEIITQEGIKKAQQIQTMKTRIEKLENDLKSRNSKVEKLEHALTETKATLTVKKNEIRSLKARSGYQSLKRRQKYLKSKEITLQNQEKQLGLVGRKKLENKVRALRKKISKQKQKLGAASSREQELKQKLNEVEDRSCMLEADKVDVESDRLELREDTSGHPYKKSVEKCVMELCGENDIPTTKVGNVIGVVSKWIFNKNTVESVPSASTANRMMDRAHVLSKLQVREGISESEGWTLHGDGTSRDGKKIVGQQVTLDSGETLSGGFSNVAVEDSTTLLDNVISMLEELSWLADEDKMNEIHKEMLGKMFAVMSDRSSVNKSFNTKLNEYRESLLQEDSVDLQFLYCNAHFLLGLSNICENVLKEIEKTLVQETGHGLGRDAFSKFARFNSSGESVGARYVRTACDVLGPRGDQKNGCKQQWDAFCQENLKLKSNVTSFRMNRFNNFFQGAAGLFSHRDHIKQFFTEYKEDLNLKLQSVLHDNESDEVNAIIRALGIIFFVVTGPFWKMLHSETEYVDQYKYIQKMLNRFREWSQNSSELLTTKTCIFPDLHVDNDKIWDDLVNDEIPRSDLTQRVLEEIMTGFIKVTEKQLGDFLPGGKFGDEPSEELRCKMKSCKLTNLVSEYEFGDLDFSQFRRRHASLHFHSSIQMVKRNRTISKWLSSKPLHEQGSLLKICKEKSDTLKRKHIEAERIVMRKVEERLQETNRKKKEKEALKLEKTKTLVDTVKKHGGPCITPAEVDNLMCTNKSKNEKMEIIKNEIRYLKTVLGVLDKRLVFGKKTLEELMLNLKAVLGVSAHLERPDNHPSSEIDPSDEPSSKRKKKERSNIEQASTSSQSMNLPSFSFSNQGVWVAVAYETDWFIGSVIEVIAPERAVIQFMTCGHGNTYHWPRVEDLDTVNKEFIFAHGFDVTSSNGRTWVVPERDYLKQLYQRYHNIYFSKSIDNI